MKSLKGLSEEHKKGRVILVQTAFNTKSIVYLTSNYKIKQHGLNFTGNYIEKAVYKNNNVIIYDTDSKEIDRQEGAKPEAKSTSKLSKDADGKSS